MLREPEQQFTTIRALAETLGLSVATVGGLARDGAVKSIKVGRRVLIPISEAERLMSEGARKDA